MPSSNALETDLSLVLQHGLVGGGFFVSALVDHTANLWHGDAQQDDGATHELGLARLLPQEQEGEQHAGHR